MKSALNNPGPQRINPTDSDSPLTFPLAAPSGHIINLNIMPKCLKNTLDKWICHILI